MVDPDVFPGNAWWRNTSEESLNPTCNEASITSQQYRGKSSLSGVLCLHCRGGCPKLWSNLVVDTPGVAGPQVEEGFLSSLVGW